MATETPDRKVNTDAPIRNDGVKRLPNERDESPDGQPKPTRGIMRQAADDLAQGLVDTDLHGARDAEAAAPGGGSGQARPHADAAHGMRDAEAAAPGGGSGQARPHADAAHGMRDAAAAPATTSKDHA